MRKQTKRAVRCWTGGPPPIEQGSFDGYVKFTAKDVQKMSEAAALTCPPDLTAAAEAIGRCFDYYVINIRQSETLNARAEIPEWGNSLSLWADTGLELLGVTRPDRAPVAATMHLTSAFPAPGSNDEEKLLRRLYNLTGRETSASRDELLGRFTRAEADALQIIQELGPKVTTTEAKKKRLQRLWLDWRAGSMSTPRGLVLLQR